MSEAEQPSVDPKTVKLSTHPSYNAFLFLAFLLPLFGLIAGIVLMTKDGVLDKRVGEHTLVMSLVFGFFWFIFGGMFLGEFYKQLMLL
jgi:hypothetical protein